MLLSEVCIKRPVFATVLSLLIIMLGVMGYLRLPLRALPNIDPAIITITASYPGADATYMENNITLPIEKALRTVKNVDFTTSESSAGSASITISFLLSANIDEALNDINSKLSSINDFFPVDMKPPTASKANSDAWPVLWLVATSDRHDDMTLTDIIAQNITKSLEKIESVSEARLFGARSYNMNIEPDPIKLNAFKITPIEIESAILSQNRDYPAGQIKTDSRDFILKLQASLKTEKEFAKIIVKSSPSLTRLEDVAKVTLSPEDSSTILRYNGNKGIAIGLIKESSSNLISLSHDVRAALPSLQKSLPAGVKLTIAFDQSTSVEASIDSVYSTIFEALLLVILIVYLFLQSARITIIPFVTIPISLIGTFAFMKLLGFSINTFTLLAMILAIGLVVDDAIVMLENIFRHHEEGQSPKEAALSGVNEIGFAIIAMTITLVAVFLPIGFIQGFLGKLFIEFAWTLAFCVLVSGFVALTLTPMMASLMLGGKTSAPPKILVKFQHWLERITELYSFYLQWLFEHKRIFWLVCGGSIAVLVLSFILVNKAFAPEEDDGFLQIVATGPEGSNIKHSFKVIEEIEEILSTTPNVFGYFTITNPDSAFAFVPLIPWEKRNKSQKQIQGDLNKQLFNIPGMSVFAIAPRSLASGNAKKAIEFYITSNNSEWKELDEASESLLKAMKSSPIFQDVERDLKISTPTINLEVDRDKSYLYGAPLNDIGRTIQYLIGGKQIGYFTMGNDNYNVTLRFPIEDRSNISDLNKIYIKNHNGVMLNLSSVVDIKESISIKSYNHYNGAKSVTISAELGPNNKINNAIDFITNWYQNNLDNNKMNIGFLGEIKRMNEANSNILSTFLLALIFIYLILSAQFESFKDPLIILMAVPFSITGAVFTLLICGNSINLYSNIGLVTLIGLVTKNSIMIVEFANQLHEQGKNVYDAITYSAKIRLRPILMTSAATICGAIPLILRTGAGAESCHSIGLVIVGGMTLGTLFTLFVIPILYNRFKT